MKNKKIVSYTLAATLATSIVPNADSEVVSATENNSVENNADENLKENVEVEIENTEKIQDQDADKSDESTDEVKNESDVIEDEIKDNTIEEKSLEDDEEVVKSEEISKAKEKEEKIEVKKAEGKVVGKLEVDMNFPLPLADTSNLGISLNLKNSNKELIGKVDINDILNGNLNSGVTYTVEKLNSKKQPLEQGDSIYYIRVVFEGLERGNYSVDIDGEGYINTTVDNIDIVDYSKRIKLGTSINEMISNENYNPVFLAGDVNNDFVIDMKDYKLVFDAIGSKDSKYDLNRDGSVDIADLSYVNSNIGKTKGQVEIVDLEKILDPENIDIDTKDLKGAENIKDILTSADTVVNLERADGEAPSADKPLTISMGLDTTKNGTLRTANSEGVEMESVVIKGSAVEGEDASIPSQGYITYTDVDGNTETVPFNEENLKRSGSSNDVVIDLGSQVAVKQISINVTGNRGNKKISQIAKIEFLNNVYKEVPKPDMNIPTIKSLETSTNLHDERITISWEPQANVTSYEVMYQKLNESGQVISTKKLQTNKTNLNILDKDIKPYDLYRVSIQSLSGEWSSGYLTEKDVPTAFDGKADNVDADFNPIDSYYNGDKGSVSEIQVIPLNSPEPPRNLTTNQGYKSFTVSWEQHSQARDFDIYYRKVGDSNKNWIKANDNHKEVIEGSSDITNPDKSKLVRSHSYTVNNLDDNATYEVRVTATNHLGTSEMSKSYIASTTSVTPPSMQEYKLINRPTSENEIGTTHIVDVRNKKDENGWNQQDDYLHYDSKYALVDGDFTTEWKVDNWDTGASYGADRGSEITFDDTYTIGSIGIGRTLQSGHYMGLYKVKVTYWDENDNKNVVYTESINEKWSNGNSYYMVKLNEPIRAKKIKVDTSGYGGSTQIISELKFYEYDSLSDDIKNLYEDDLRLVLKKSVTQDVLNELAKRLDTPDAISGEYHPDKDVLKKELDTAQKLFDDKEVSEKITTLDASIRTNNEGPSLGMGNSYQSLGSVARPSVDDKGTSKQIVVYMGSSDPNTRVDIVFLQNYGLPGSYMSKVQTVSPGRTEITIPSIISADVEKGGQVMARVTQGSTTANVQIRLSGVTEIPNLNVNNMINDTTKEKEVKDKIRNYISELKTYMNDINTLYPSEVSDKDKINNVYLYDEQTSPLNTTDIEGDRFTLTLPASEILKGIESGLEGNTEAQVNRVYDALLAWEQEVKVGFAKKGVFEEVQDFNGNGEIDDEDRAYFRKHRAPLTRLNIKYQRMMMGAAAYASNHHIGVGFSSSQYIQGVPYKFDENGKVTNADSAHLYGGLIGHEMGHVMDIGDRLYPETSNNLMTAITGTMLNENSPYFDSFKKVYEKVTSNTIGLSTDRTVVLNMLWQPYLAYEDNITYEMLFTDVDADLTNDSYFAKLNRAYREMSAEERFNGDRDQWLIRLTSKVVGKDLTDFYEAHGIIANETTLAYVSKFPKETKKIQYINDEARRQRIAGTADMEEGTTLSASFADGITTGSYVDSKEVKINLSVDKSNDRILGYEIYRNGEPCGFIERDKANSQTVYTDTVENINNRVVEYKAVAYDYNLNPTNEVQLGTVKIRHEGGVDKKSLIISSNTISLHEESNDIHSCDGNEDLKHALDNDKSTVYEGRMLTKDEYNSSIHTAEMNPNNNPYVILDTTEMKTLVGIKYTAPTTKSGFIFKSTSIADNALKKYKIEVSKDGASWTTVKEGTLNLDPQNPTETIYFDAEGVTGGNQLSSYNARYVKITALDTKNFAASELDLITPPGDNIEIGLSDDNITYTNGIGVLKNDYEYQADNPDTNENERKFIPAGSVIITGEYRGNPAFNVPLVLNEKEQHIADKYQGILLAQVPDNGNLEEVAEGTWIYWVNPEDAKTFNEDNKKIFAELYRTDAADALEGGQRLVSDTFKIDVPKELPEITLSASSRSVNEVKAIDIKTDILNAIKENR